MEKSTIAYLESDSVVQLIHITLEAFWLKHQEKTKTVINQEPKNNVINQEPINNVINQDIVTTYFKSSKME